MSEHQSSHAWMGCLCFAAVQVPFAHCHLQVLFPARPYMTRSFFCFFEKASPERTAFTVMHARSIPFPATHQRALSLPMRLFAGEKGNESISNQSYCSRVRPQCGRG